MKNLVITIILSIVCLTQVVAQQMTLQSQYMINKFSINPAFAGTQEGMPVHLSMRRQWYGIKEAPASQYLSMNTSIIDGIGVGANIYNEVAGPTRRTGISIGTAYNLQLGGFGQNSSELSFGINLMLNQFALDKTKLETYLPDDPTINAAYGSQLLPDAGFGVYYHNSDKYFASVSATNLFQTRVDILNVPNYVRNNFVRNYYIMGGGNIPLGDMFKIQPTLLFQMIEALTTQFDINVRGIYDDKYWAGVSYRNQDAVIAMIGLNLAGVGFGYSYDVTLSNVRNYSSGSHEIRLSYRMPSIVGGNRNQKGITF